ncbi:CDP-diacylglycerol--glycerol-3-phosphate 3-phosphatidyltransferase [Nocardioides scoriae]|uniref:CDP-diacylglycerol--glycerol-3-phosphate 3-phosphatidyltransferase n=1 Tax=Nocardioides scoriae TaxID=642780 RepID=A0A1H1NQX3_9ACTN|nr:CDP-alcohol phosphatidyltransferase family protein [Nocardioides scoriae]SDS01145.1 CDP-diacylglycerol--glycerol-3-phosphate 3-phosphatidyltransferase [Nocardioides scoriae]
MSGPVGGADPSDPSERAYDLWAGLHEGVDPRGSVWVAGWVRLVHRCARPLAGRGVRPDTVTLVGVLVAGTAPVLATLPAGWPLLAVVAVLAAAVLDGVDGALAARTGRATAWGRVLDPLADRCSDVLLLLVLLVLGAPWWLVGLVVVATLLLESVRAHAQVAGLHGPGAITVWERPARVIVAVLAVLMHLAELAARGLGVAVLPRVDGPGLVTALAVVAALLAGAGLVSLVVAVRRALPG